MVVASAPQLTPPRDGDTSRGPMILAIAIASLTAALMCVAMRVYVRIRIRKAFWWDDGFLLAGLARRPLYDENTIAKYYF